MSFKLFLGISIIPGMIAAAFVSRHYYRNIVSDRYTFLPLDPLLERQISRKILRTWGEKITMKHKVIENNELENAWNHIKKLANANLPGKLYLLDTDEHVFQLFPTGDLFISTCFYNSLSKSSLKIVLAHELAHIQLHHAQESLPYSKIMALIVAWLCYHNHHFTTQLKTYLFNPSYTSLHEYEANTLAKKYLNHNYPDFFCDHASK